MPSGHSGVRRKRSLVLYGLVVLSLLIGLVTFSPPAPGKEAGLVYVVDVHGVVEKGLYAYMERAFKEAEEAGADQIILDIDTPGGAIDAAKEIGELIQTSPLPVTAYINPHATSAGAYIALSADTIVMVPTGTMGSSQVVDLAGNAADEKVQSLWKSMMSAAAEKGGRDPLYALAMVDPSIEIEGLVREGELLNFRASQALQYGYAESIAENLDEVLQFLQLPKAEVVYVDISWAERLARFITHPVLASLLLTIGGLGIVIELFTPGFGLPGIAGLCGLGLYFFGHMAAGLAGWEAVLLFGAGLVLLLIEVLVPGFGIFGILGIVALIAGMALGSGDFLLGIKYVGAALLLSLLALILLSRFYKGLSRKNTIWSHMVLEEGLSTEETQSLREERSALIGKRGVTLTPLRLAGSVQIDDRRYDVVSDGQWVEKGRMVEVIKVDGPRIVVRPVEDDNS